MINYEVNPTWPSLASYHNGKGKIIVSPRFEVLPEFIRHFILKQVHLILDEGILCADRIAYTDTLAKYPAVSSSELLSTFSDILIREASDDQLTIARIEALYKFAGETK